jgi:anti-anti-sigma factor
MDRISSSFDLPLLGISARWARRAGRITVLVSGELDMATAEPLAKAIRDATHAGDHLVLDLGDVTFCGAAGVEVLEDLRDAVTVTGGRLTLRDPSTAVRRILAVTRLTDEFEIDGRARRT